MKFLWGIVLMAIVFGGISAALHGGAEDGEADNLQLIAERKRLIEELIASFEKSDDLEYKRSVIYALGEMRAVEAVPFILANLSFGITVSTPPWPKYGFEPSVDALVKIGMPSIPATVELLKKSGDDVVQRVLCRILLDIAQNHNLNKYDFAFWFLAEEIEKTEDMNEIAVLKETEKTLRKFYVRDMASAGSARSETE